MERGVYSFNKFEESVIYRMGRHFRVVASSRKRTIQKCEFCTLLTVLLRSRRGHGAKVSKRIEKVGFLAFQRCGNLRNSRFRPESSNPRKTPRLEGGPYPNRPSRFQRASKFRDPYVLTRGTSILWNSEVLEFTISHGAARPAQKSAI